MNKGYTTGDATLIFKGLTMEQAKCLANWYEGQGEQDADLWFDINGVPTPMSNVQSGYMKIDEKNKTITCQLQPHRKSN